ncbi:MAG TPA: hypothetical protein VFM99_03645 [Chitinophagales bacterium]|nr:hypothetical protein [Chitinophagales bacterium]
MTGEKILEIIKVYQILFDDLQIEPLELPHRTTLQEPEDALSHCCAMLPKIAALIEEQRIEKAFRWLGFVQGVLWATGQYNLNSLKGHSKP